MSPHDSFDREYSSECECGEPQRWAAMPNFPIVFDPRLNEFHLVHGGIHALMRYCFWCGGRLPESKRKDLHSEPSDVEQEEIRLLLKQAESIQDVLRVLGEPDNVLDGSGGKCNKDGGGRVEWKKTLRYSSRWKTLVLDVIELPNGTVSFLTCGQYVGKS